MQKIESYQDQFLNQARRPLEADQHPARQRRELCGRAGQIFNEQPLARRRDHRRGERSIQWILLQSDGKQQMIYKHAVSTMTPMTPVRMTQE